MSINQATGVGSRLSAVAKSDTTIISCQALYVGTTGDLVLMGAGDTVAVTLSSVPAGAIIPVSCIKVMAATTASNIVAISI